MSNGHKAHSRGRRSGILKVLVVDIGGSGIKVLSTGEAVRRRLPSGKDLTPKRAVEAVKKLANGWSYDVVSIGYPGRVVDGQPMAEPRNLAAGWVGFDYTAAFGCPVKIINDAALQALGSYHGGTLLFLGFGTGLGSALVVDGGLVIPLELEHLPFKRGTIEDYVGSLGLERHGKRKWRGYVDHLIERVVDAIHPDDVVIGGGNAKKLERLPRGCRLGSNANAFIGGFRLWGQAASGLRRSQTVVDARIVG